MAALKARSAMLWLSALMVSFCLPQTIEAQTTLRAQALGSTLQRLTANPDLSYLLLDGHGNLIAENWPEMDRPVPIGSLIKPFVAVGYGRAHGAFPKLH